MANTNRREEVETTGLVCVRHSTGLTPQGRARDAAGLPTGPLDEDVIDQCFELQEDGESRQSVIDSMRKAAENYRNGGRLGDRLADELLHFADRVEQIHETVGELLARTGLEEGDRVEIRFPTPAEELAKLAKVVAAMDARTAGRSLHQPLKDDGSTRCTVCGGFTLHFDGCAADRDVSDHLTNARPAARRDAKGAPIDAVRWEEWPETEGARP